MSISVQTGATGFTVTGGTSRTFSPDGQTVTNGVHMSDAAVTDFRVRPHITVKNRNPQRQPDGTYSKGKREVITTYPFLKADGTIGFNTRRDTEEYDAEASAALLKDLRYMAVQFQFDSEMENFHVAGSIPA